MVQQYHAKFKKLVLKKSRNGILPTIKARTSEKLIKHNHDFENFHTMKTIQIFVIPKNSGWLFLGISDFLADLWPLETPLQIFSYEA